MAQGISFKITGLAEATGELKAAMLLGAARGMEKIGLRGEQIFTQHAPVGATGNLAHGIFAEFHQQGPVMHETLQEAPPADVYAAPVETGAKPHFPPTEALLLWVKQKLGVRNEKEAKSVAFLIARAISKRGTKGAHMFDATLEQLGREAPAILEVEIARAVEAAGFGAKD